MKKIILFVFSMLLAVSAFAGTVYVPFRDTGIITQDIATGFHRTGRFTTSGLVIFWCVGICIHIAGLTIPVHITDIMHGC